MRPAVFLVWLLFFPLQLLAAPAILVLGDSLSAGYGIEQKASWVHLLEKRLMAQGYSYTVINASISGETTMGGLTRINNELEKHQPSLVIIELGGNDGLRGLSIQQLEKNLAQIIDASLQKNANVVLVGMQIPPNYGPTYTKAFSDSYTNLAKTYDIKLVPFLLNGLGEDRQHFQSDGIHPTSAAQPLLLENVWVELKPLL